MSDLNLVITAVQREQTRLQAMHAEADYQLGHFSRSAGDDAILGQLPGLMDVLMKTEFSLGFRSTQVARLQTELGVLAHGNTDEFCRDMMRAMHPFPPARHLRDARGACGQRARGRRSPPGLSGPVVIKS